MKADYGCINQASNDNASGTHNANAHGPLAKSAARNGVAPGTTSGGSGVGGRGGLPQTQRAAKAAGISQGERNPWGRGGRTGAGARKAGNVFPMTWTRRLSSTCARLAR